MSKQDKMKLTANLTIKQEKFCIAYIETGNASKAYRVAYNTSKMKPETINRNAKALLDDSKIATRTKELMKPVFDKLQVTKEKTLTRLMQGQEFDVRNLYDENGKLKQPKDLDDNTAKAIAGVKYDREGNLIEYKIIDIKGCCELIGRNLKMFTDKIEVGGGITVTRTKKSFDGN